MADFNTGIEGYGDIGGAESTTQSGEAYTSLDVSGMTVQDIKTYIDLLSKQAGYLTEQEITQKINEIAQAAGMLSEQEIQAIVINNITSAGVATTAEMDTSINTKVAAAILALNDNKDYISDIRLHLKQDIDRVRSELRLVQRDSNEVHGDVQQLTQDYNYQLASVNQSMNLFESVLDSIVESKEIHNLLDIERTSRNMEIQNLSTEITLAKNASEIAVGINSLNIDATNTRLTTAMANSNNSFVALANSLRTRMTTIEAQNTDSANTLSALLLSGDALVEKLNALNSVDLGENGNIIVNLQNELSAVMQELASLSSETTMNAAILQTKVQEIDALKTDVEDEVINMNTTVAVGLDNLGGKLNIEIDERRMTFDLLVNDWNEFTIRMTQQFTSTQTKVNSLSLQVAEFPAEITRMIDVEREGRLNAFTDVNIRLTREAQLLREEIAESNLDLEVDELRVNLIELAKKYDKAIIEEQQAMFNDIAIKYLEVKNEIAIKNSILNGQIDVERDIRTAEDTAIMISVSNESSIRETRVQELKDQIQTLNNAFDNVLANVAVGDTVPLQALIDDLNTRYNGIFDQVDDLSDLHTTHNTALNARLDVAETSIASVQSAAISDVQSEAVARVAGDDALAAEIAILIGRINVVVGNLGVTANFEEVYSTITNLRNEVDAFKLNFDDAIQIEISNLNTRLDNLTQIDNQLQTQLDAEALTREASDLSLQSKIDLNLSKFAPLEQALHSEITNIIVNTESSLDAITDDLAIETQARIDGDALRGTELDIFGVRMDDLEVDLQSDIDSINTIVQDINTDLSAALNSEIATRTQNVQTIELAAAAEATTRAAADAALSARIDSQTTTIQAMLNADDMNIENLRAVLELIENINNNPDANVTNQILDGLNNVENNLTALIEAEEAARIQAIIDLEAASQALVDAVNVALTLEIQNRVDGDIALNDTITQKELDAIDRETSLRTVIDQEVIDRAQGDSAIQDLLTAEANRAQSAESDLEDAVALEEQARTLADNAFNIELADTNSTIVNNISRIATLEIKETSLMAGLPVEVASLKDLLDLITGNYATIDTRIVSEVTALNTRIDNNVSGISNEVAARLLEDSLLDGKITTLATDVQTADAAIIASVTTEETARISGDNVILTQVADIVAVNATQQNQIDAGASNLSTESTTRAEEDNLIRYGLAVGNDILFDAATYKTVLALSQEADAKTAALASTNANLATEISARISGDDTLTTAITQETADRTTADGTLQTNLDNVEGNLTSSIGGVDTRLATVETTVNTIMLDADGTSDSFKEVKTLIDQNRSLSDTAINNLDSTLSADILNNTSLITNETSARTSGDTTLNTKINQEISDRTSADNSLQTNITNEASTRSTDDVTLQTNINTEVSARKSADITLQGNIDAKPDSLNELSGTPSTMIGSELFIVRVNAAGTELEYVDHAVVAYTPRLDVMLESTDISATTYVIDGTETDRIDVITYGNAYTGTYVYNVSDVLTTIEYRDDTSTLIATKAFGYNGNGRLDTITWTTQD